MKLAMKYFFLTLLSLQLALQSGLATAQSSCSSDGVQALRQVTERFISAACATCWTAPLAAPKAELVLDWIVPSAAGEEAALSAAAHQDALTRLDALAVVLNKDQHLHRTTATAPTAYTLRVAHGLAVNSYVGTSIELTKRPKHIKKLESFLLLVEHIPQGTADSPVDRLLVRNMLQESWNLVAQPTLLSRRPMSIPTGANPDNLRVVGWVQDAQGRVLAMAQSRCSSRP